MSPSYVTMFVRLIASVSSMSMAPVAVVSTIADVTWVSRVMGPAAFAVSSLAVTSMAAVPSSVMKPATAVSVTSFRLPALTETRFRSPTVVLRVIEFVPSSVLLVLTEVATSCPAASIVIGPLAVVIVVSVIASVSSRSIAPAAVVLISVLVTWVSRVIGPAAVMVSRSA